MSLAARARVSRRALMAGFAIGAVAAVVLAVVWFFARPARESESVESTLNACADLFDARHWEGLAEYAWPAGKRADVQEMLTKRVPPGFHIKRPVAMDRPFIEGDRAKVMVTVEWSMMMGRLQDKSRINVDLVRHDGRWYVDASDMMRWWP